MLCRKCTTDNLDDNKFCKNCGNALNDTSLDGKYLINEKRLDYTYERSHVLIQLRYQLAIAIIVLITGVWTVLFTSEGLKDYLDTLIIIGWVITVALVVVWRFFTHKIFNEEQALNVSRLFYLLDLNINVKEDDTYGDFEERFNLCLNNTYRDFDTKKKLEVMKKLQYFLREEGIFGFTENSMAGILASGGVLVCTFFLKPEFDVLTLFIRLTIIYLVISASACFLIYYLIIKPTNPNNERTHRIIGEVM